MFTRRDAIKTTALAATAYAAIPSTLMAQAAPPAIPSAGSFKLPSLPYAVDALEPHIDAKTMETHHGKHHAAYVTNLNKAIAEEPSLANKTVEQIIRDLEKIPGKIRTAVRNNGGGHFNHDLFWRMLTPAGGRQPAGELAKAIDASFGSFSGFKEKMTETATRVFGSGWAWLVSGDDGKLAVVSSANQDSPVMGLFAGFASPQRILLGLDVWEHAYYLKYQNRRPDYIHAWFNVINWDFVAERHSKRDLD